MRRTLRYCACLLLAAMEPVCHAFGIPHPEGLSTQAINLLLTQD